MCGENAYTFSLKHWENDKILYKRQLIGIYFETLDICLQKRKRKKLLVISFYRTAISHLPFFIHRQSVLIEFNSGGEYLEQEKVFFFYLKLLNDSLSSLNIFQVLLMIFLSTDS